MNNLKKAKMINNEIWKIALTKVDKAAKDDFQNLLDKAKNPLESIKHSYKMICKIHNIEAKKELLEL